MILPVVLWHRTPFTADDNRATFKTERVRGCRSRTDKADGYTLLELVIVLAIISVLAAVSTPALMRPWSKSYVQQAGQELSRILLKARLDSIQHGVAYQFRWRENTGEFEVAAWQDASQSDSLPLASRDAHPVTSRTAQTEPTRRAATARREPADVRDNNPGKLPTSQSAERPISGRLVNNVVFAPDHRPPLHQHDPRSEVDAGVTTPIQSAPRHSAPRQSANRVEDRLELARADSQQQQIQRHRPWAEPIWFFPDGRTSSAELVLQAEDGYAIRLSLRGMTGTVRVSTVKKVELPTLPGGNLPRGYESPDPNSTDGQRR